MYMPQNHFYTICTRMFLQRAISLTPLRPGQLNKHSYGYVDNKLCATHSICAVHNI